MQQSDHDREEFNIMKPEQLRAAREEMGLTQVEAAKKYNVKLRTYKNYELGNTAIPGPVKLLTVYFLKEYRNI